MKEFIENHRQTKQKYEQTRMELHNLQLREKELKGRITKLSSEVISAEHLISKALTSESLEKARAEVEAVQRREGDAKTLLSNTERAIGMLKQALPGLNNDIALAEQTVWQAQLEQLIAAIKTKQDVLHLIMQAYVAAWYSGYRWEFEIFIREKIMGAKFHVDPDILAQFKAEMAEQIWPQADIQT